MGKALTPHGAGGNSMALVETLPPLGIGGTNMALVEALTPHGIGGTNRNFLNSGKFLVSGRPGPRSYHWNTRLAGIAGIKGDLSLG